MLCKLIVLMLAVLRAAPSHAQDCIAAETGAEILSIVRSEQGHALICLTGDPTQPVNFRTVSRLVVPENGNVTIQCGERFLDTYSGEGPMQLLENAVIGLQGCKINTFRDLDEAISAGSRSDAFLSVFGNTLNAVAQFTAQLTRTRLESMVQNVSDISLRIGEEAIEGEASAMTFIDANFKPGPFRTTNIRFDFQQVTAWHAPQYSDAVSVIEKAKLQTISFSPEVEYCCAAPIEERMRPPSPDDEGRDLTNMAIIVILVVVVLAVIFLGVLAYYCLRSDSYTAGPYLPTSMNDPAAAPLSGPPSDRKRGTPLSRLMGGGRGSWGPGKEGGSDEPHPTPPNLRAQSMVETPDPSAMIVKAHESLSFTVNGGDAPGTSANADSGDASGNFKNILGSHVTGLEQIMHGINPASRSSHHLPEEHVGHRSFALWSGTNNSGTPNTSNASNEPIGGVQNRGSIPSTLAASTAPRGSSSTGDSSGRGTGFGHNAFGAYQGTVTNAVAAGGGQGQGGKYPGAGGGPFAPPGVVGFPQQQGGGALANEDLKIYNLLDRGRDSAVYQGMWRNTAVAVSVVSVKLGPRSCRRVLGAESIVATNLDHPNVVATYVYDSVEQPPDVNNDGASSSGFKGNSGSRAFAIQELCNGGNLRSALRRGVLSPGGMQPRWPSVLRILSGVAAGMDHMHTLRVYHGALSPSHILFKYSDNSKSLFTALRTNQAVAKVTGYTSALRVHRMAAETDRYSTFYSAPDAPVWPRLSPAADVFAFGVIMWELMTGSLVYEKPTKRSNPDAVQRPQNAYSLLQFNLGGRRNSGNSAYPEQEAPDSDGDPDNLSHHPGYPNLPLRAPLTYALAMQACLSPNSAERPTFRQLVSLLDDLAAEVASGAYIDSSGSSQPASAVEEAHMSACAPPSRAAIAHSASSEHHSHLRSGFQNILPSLSVAGTILEEGETSDELASSMVSSGLPVGGVSGSAVGGGSPLSRSDGTAHASQQHALSGHAYAGNHSFESETRIRMDSATRSTPVDTGGEGANSASEDESFLSSHMNHMHEMSCIQGGSAAAQWAASHMHAAYDSEGTVGTGSGMHGRSDSGSIPTRGTAQVATRAAMHEHYAASPGMRQRDAYSASLGHGGEGSGRLSEAQGSSPSHAAGSDVSLAQLHMHGGSSSQVQGAQQPSGARGPGGGDCEPPFRGDEAGGQGEGASEPPVSGNDDSPQATRPSRAYSNLPPPLPKDHLPNIVRPWQHQPQPLGGVQAALAGPTSATSSTLSPTAIEAALAQPPLLSIQPPQSGDSVAAGAGGGGGSGSISHGSSGALARSMILPESMEDWSSSSSMWALLRDRLQNSERLPPDTIAPDNPPRVTPIPPGSSPQPTTNSSALVPNVPRQYPASDPIPSHLISGSGSAPLAGGIAAAPANPPANAPSPPTHHHPTFAAQITNTFPPHQTMAGSASYDPFYHIAGVPNQRKATHTAALTRHMDPRVATYHMHATPPGATHATYAQSSGRTEASSSSAAAPDQMHVAHIHEQHAQAATYVDAVPEAEYPGSSGGQPESGSGAVVQSFPLQHNDPHGQQESSSSGQGGYSEDSESSSSVESSSHPPASSEYSRRAPSEGVQTTDAEDAECMPYSQVPPQLPADSDAAGNLTLMHSSMMHAAPHGVSTGDSTQSEASASKRSDAPPMHAAQSAAVQLSPPKESDNVPTSEDSQPPTHPPSDPHPDIRSKSPDPHMYPPAQHAIQPLDPVSHPGKPPTAQPSVSTAYAVPAAVLSSRGNSNTASCEFPTAKSARTPDSTVHARVFTISSAMEASPADFQSKTHAQPQNAPEVSRTEDSVHMTTSPVTGGVVTEVATRTNRAAPQHATQHAPQQPQRLQLATLVAASQAHSGLAPAYAATMHATAPPTARSDVSRGSATSHSHVLSSTQSLRNWHVTQGASPGTGALSSFDESVTRDKDAPRPPLPPGPEFAAHLELQPPPNFCLRQWGGSTSDHSESMPQAFSGPDPLNPAHHVTLRNDGSSISGGSPGATSHPLDDVNLHVSPPTSLVHRDQAGEYGSDMPTLPPLAPPIPWHANPGSVHAQHASQPQHFGSAQPTGGLPLHDSMVPSPRSCSSPTSPQSRAPLQLDARTDSFLENGSGAGSVDLSEFSQGGWSSRISWALPGVDASSADDPAARFAAGTAAAAAPEARGSAAGGGGGAAAASAAAATAAATAAPAGGALRAPLSAASPASTPKATPPAAEASGTGAVHTSPVTSSTMSPRKAYASVASFRVSSGGFHSTGSSHRTTTISEQEAEVIEASIEASKEGSASAALRRFQAEKQAKLRKQERSWEEKVLEASSPVNDRETSGTHAKHAFSRQVYIFPSSNAKTPSPGSTPMPILGLGGVVSGAQSSKVSGMFSGIANPKEGVHEELEDSAANLRPPRTFRKPRRHMWSSTGDTSTHSPKRGSNVYVPVPSDAEVADSLTTSQNPVNLAAGATADSLRPAPPRSRGAAPPQYGGRPVGEHLDSSMDPLYPPVVPPQQHPDVEDVAEGSSASSPLPVCLGKNSFIF